jgi:PAS domain S-box-containing protein
MFGLTAEAFDAGGIALLDLRLADQLVEPVTALCATPIAHAETIDTLRFPDGRAYERFVAPHRVDGSVAGRFVSFRDVSRAALAEKALNEERAFLEKAQEVAHVGSWSAELDGSGRLNWSSEMYRILGLSTPTPASRTQALAEFVHANDRDMVRRKREAAVRSGEPYDIEHRILRPDGAVRWVHTCADVIRDASGRPVRVVGTMQDITERRELEEQLRQSQRLEAVGRLAGGVAHDLNNALTTIIGYSELVLDAMAVDHPLNRDLIEIRRAAERAETVIRQLLAFSRRQFAEPRIFHLGESVHEIGRMLERLLAPAVIVTTEYDPDLPPIYGDPGQIEQAITNLALNARDAMVDGGRFLLKVSLVDVDAVTIRLRPPHVHGSYVELSATDTGEGMTPETLAHIFEPFFTTKDVGKGTGLGLSMVYGTVQQVGGFIDVESEPRNGTTFRLYFPPAPARTETPVAPPPLVSPHLATVLVVEEQAAIRDLAAASLRRAGYRVLAAESGKEALALASAKGARVDLLLTDVHLQGITGRELAGMVRERHPALRVLFTSMYPPQTLELPGLLPAFAVLPKPFTQVTLRDKVQEMLGAISGGANEER